MQSVFGSNSQDKSIDDLKKQVAELQAQLQVNKIVTPQTPLIVPQEKEEVLYKWNAPERLFVQREKQWYWTAALVVLIVTVVLLIFGEPILVGAVFSILFVLYVTTSVPPTIVDNSITTWGIRTASQLFTWDKLEDFWFSYRMSKEILNIDTKMPSPSRLTLFFTKRDKQKIIEILKERLPYRTPPKKQGWLSRSSEGIYIPMEDMETSVTLDKQYQRAS